MPVDYQCGGTSLSQQDVRRLWEATIKQRDFPDEIVVVRCVSMAKMQQLNRRYRSRNKPTNVLTFSYDGEHDVVLCLPVARQEAATVQTELKDYLALVLVHAFLHVTGLDHTTSLLAEAQTRAAEKGILAAAGFAPLHL